MGLHTKQFFVLIWKNIVIQKRRPGEAAMLIIFPAIIFLGLIFARNIGQPPDHIGQRSFEKYNVEKNLDKIKNKMGGKLKIFWYPETCKRCQNCMQQVQEVGGLRDVIEVKSYSDRNKMINKTLELDYDDFFGVIEFGENLNDNTTTDITKATLRYQPIFRVNITGRNSTEKMLNGDIWNWQTHRMYRRPYLDYNLTEKSGDSLGYGPEGVAMFVWYVVVIFHNWVARRWTHKGETNPDKPICYMQRFSEIAHVEDRFLDSLKDYIPTCICIALLPTVCVCIGRMTAEKQMKEMLRIAGISKLVYWSSWYVYCLGSMGIVAALLVFALKQSFANMPGFPSLLPNSNIYLLILLMFIYISSVICFMFLMACIFQDATTAAIVGVTIYFLTCLPHIFFFFENVRMSYYGLILVSLFSNITFGISFKLMYILEINNQGVQFSNFYSFAILHPSMTMLYVMVIMTLDAAVYLLIALYIETVRPGKYGSPRPMTFFIDDMFTWRTVVADVPDEIPYSKNFEKDPKDLHPIIKLRNVRKKYSNGNVGLASTNLNIFEKQTTIVIGHNGAGKTTLLNVITGFERPSTGDVIINHFNQAKQLSNIREDLGYCSQENVLYKEMNAVEHMLLFGRVRGAEVYQMHEEIGFIVGHMQLGRDATKPTSKLSMGTKRKICVAMAFCGGPRTVVLDEPTIELDYKSKISVWDLMNTLKEGRTIVISTNLMDEAEILGDRIIAMKGGRIKCLGSTQFLMEHNNIDGYHLAIIKRTCCNVNELTIFLQTFFPDIRLRSNQKFAVNYYLDEQYASQYSKLLRQLEINKDKLCVDSYTIRRHNLRELFMKLCVPQRKLTCAKKKYNLHKFSHTGSNQVIAMFMKHAIITSRDWDFLALKLLVPFFILTLFVSITPYHMKELPPLVLDHNYFSSKPVTLFSGENKRFQSLGFPTLKHAIELWNSTVDEHYLKMQQDDYVSTKYNVLYGVHSDDTGNVICYYNGDAFLHTALLCLAHLMQWATHVDLTFYPLPFNTSEAVDNAYYFRVEGYFMALSITVSLCILSSLFVVQFSQEKFGGFKQFQLFCGTHIFIYWAVAYVWDIVVFFLCMVCMMLNVYLLNTRFVNDFREIWQFFCILLCFGLTFSPMVYVFSVLFKGAPASLILLLYTLITSIVPFLIMESYNRDIRNNSPETWFLTLISPHFTVVYTVYDLYVSHRQYLLCKQGVDWCKTTQEKVDEEACWKRVCNYNRTKVCCMGHNATKLETSYNAIRKPMVYMLFSGIFFFFILLLIDFIWPNFCQKEKYLKPVKTSKIGDEDVMNEKMKVMNIQEDQRKKYMLVMDSVSKQFKKDRIVLHDINLIANRGDCVGFVGYTGAGKSVIINMLAKRYAPTWGTIRINGRDIRSDVNPWIGYNVNGAMLAPEFTVFQMILFVTMLRGYKFANCKKIAMMLAHFGNVSTFATLKIKELKKLELQKLCNLIAIVGDPIVVCLDEPTIGMDPFNKLQYWETIACLKKHRKCIVMTTDDMQECDMLSTKVGILINGRLKTIGSIRALKEKYAMNILLTIKLIKNEKSHYKDEILSSYVTLVENFVRTKFNNAVLKLNFLGNLLYEIPNYKIYWPHIFDIMENAKEHLPIERYVIQQQTLDQVYLLLNDHPADEKDSYVNL